MTEFNNTVIDNVKGDKKMKLIICMFFTCFMLFIIDFLNEENCHINKKRYKKKPGNELFLRAKANYLHRDCA